MPDTTQTANMGLQLPIVSQQVGPEWASNINSALVQIDQHNHGPGNGVPVGCNGININADLPFNNNNATSLRTARFTSLGSPASSGTDVGCIYVSGQDLYYNDTIGRQVQLTLGGNIVGASGNIQNLQDPATVVYNPGTKTFIFSSSSNVRAKMDVSDILLRNDTPGAPAITLHASSTLSGSYTLTLPTSAGTDTFVLATSANGQTYWSSRTRYQTRQASDANHTVNQSDDCVRAYYSTSSYTLYLPPGQQNPGKAYKIIFNPPTEPFTPGYQLTILPNQSPSEEILGWQTIPQSTSAIVINYPGERVELVNDSGSGGQWLVYGHSYPMDWTPYTPNFVGMGTMSGVSMWSRRVGDSLEIQGIFTTGITVATTATMSIGWNNVNNPYGIAIGTKISTSATVVGSVLPNSSAQISDFPAITHGGSTGVIYFSDNQVGGSSASTPRNGSQQFLRESKYFINMKVPIYGWV